MPPRRGKLVQAFPSLRSITLNTFRERTVNALVPVSRKNGSTFPELKHGTLISPSGRCYLAVVFPWSLNIIFITTEALTLIFRRGL